MAVKYKSVYEEALLLDFLCTDGFSFLKKNFPQVSLFPKGLLWRKVGEGGCKKLNLFKGMYFRSKHSPLFPKLAERFQ